MSAELVIFGISVIVALLLFPILDRFFPTEFDE